MKRAQRICIEQTFKQMIRLEDDDRDSIVEQVSNKDPAAGSILDQLLSALRGDDAGLDGPVAELYKRLTSRFVRV